MKLSTCKIEKLIRIHYRTWYLIPNTLIHWAENIKSLPHYCPVMKFVRHIFKEELCLWSHGCPGANILRFFWNAHRLAWKIRTSLRLHRKIYPGPSSPDIILKIYLSLYFKVEYLHLGFPLLDFVPRNCVFEILAGRQASTTWGLSSLANFLKILSSKRVCCVFRDIRDKNAVNQGFWSKTAVFSLPATKVDCLLIFWLPHLYNLLQPGIRKQHK